MFMLRINPKLNKTVYSTTEVKTEDLYKDEDNKLWPIYRKSYNGTAVKSNKVVLDTMPELNFIVKHYGSSESIYDWVWPIPSGESAGYSNQLRYSQADDTLQIYFGSNYGPTNHFHVTVEYTKTTD